MSPPLTSERPPDQHYSLPATTESFEQYYDAYSALTVPTEPVSDFYTSENLYLWQDVDGIYHWADAAPRSSSSLGYPSAFTTKSDYSGYRYGDLEEPSLPAAAQDNSYIFHLAKQFKNGSGRPQAQDHRSGIAHASDDFLAQASSIFRDGRSSSRRGSTLGYQSSIPQSSPQRNPRPSRKHSRGPLDEANYLVKRPASLPGGRLSVQVPDDEDLYNASEVPNRPDEVDLSSYPTSLCEQSAVVSEHFQMSRLSTQFPPLDLTPYIVRVSDRYSAGGGFGDVYRGWYHGGLVPKEVQVAIKAFRFKFTLTGDADDKSLKMLRRELGIWRRLNHSNIVPFLGTAYGFGMHGAMSLVSLWMPNDTLQNFMAKHDDGLGVAHRLQFLLDIANGLQYLHSFPIVHGDLNCNNVLLDADYTARLADFGYSSLVGNIPEALTYLRRSTTRPGALRWTAPEQIALEDSFIRTTRNDVYSFGCVLSGKQPWSEVREDAAVVLRLVRGYNPGRPESRPVDDLHWKMIEHCWSSVEERPAMEAIIARIKQFLSDHNHLPFRPLRDLMGMPDNSLLLGPSFSQAPTDGSYANVVLLDRDNESGITSLTGPSGSVRFRQNEDADEASLRITAAESSAESPYKRRRV